MNFVHYQKFKVYGILLAVVYLWCEIYVPAHFNLPSSSSVSASVCVS